MHHHATPGVPGAAKATTTIPRLGLTLLEVLISIGIVTIGIFGLLALLPIAGRQAERALINDRKSSMGQNVVSDFVARGYHRNDMWVVPAGGGGANPFNPSTSFCIDPHFASQYGATAFPIAPMLSGANTMPRISLRRALGQAEMTRWQAEYVCTGYDDLAIDKTKNLGDPPVQQMILDGASNPTVRQTSRGYSWMATMVPKFGANTEYILSLVIFYNRDLSNPANPSTGDFPTPERVAQVMPGFLYGNGIGGGDMQIATRPIDMGGAASDIDVQKNQWVMLAPSDPSISYFRWYRIVDCDAESIDDTANSKRYFRDITLDGPDWPYPASGSGPWTNPYVIIPTGAVAVYERTVRKEATGLWTDWN